MLFICRIVQRHWFIFGILGVIMFAKIAPNIGKAGGLLKPEITVKYVAISVIFYTSGLSMKTEKLARAVLQVNIHMFIQLFTFVVFPCLIIPLVSILSHSPMDPLLLNGLTVMSCMPPPVSSAVLLTHAVGGNEAAAIFNSVFGSLLGIFVSPLLLLRLVGVEGRVSFSSIIFQLLLTVICPLVLGQMTRSYVLSWLHRYPVPFSNIRSLMLLLIIYTTFCDTFSHVDLHFNSIYSIVLLVVCIQLVVMVVSLYLATRPVFSMKPDDAVAVLFCCSHKSLTLGIPILRIVFAGVDGLSLMTIPLLVYHPTQILLGAFLVPTIHSWMQAAMSARSHCPSRYV